MSLLSSIPVTIKDVSDISTLTEMERSAGRDREIRFGRFDYR
jgi:hypothetical protein